MTMTEKDTATVEGEGVKLTAAERKAAHESSSNACMKHVEKALVGIKSLLQSVVMAEQDVSKVAIECLKHAHDHGDVMPCDRLVKGLREFNHPVATRLSQEVISWFVANSPVRWDSKGKPRQLKEGEPGYKPYNEENAEETPFYATPSAVRARQAADAAHSRELKPADTKMLRARVYGIGKWLQKMIDGEDERGIKQGEKSKMLRTVKAIEGAMVEVLGDDEEDKKKAA